MAYGSCGWFVFFCLTVIISVRGSAVKEDSTVFVQKTPDNAYSSIVSHAPWLTGNNTQDLPELSGSSSPHTHKSIWVAVGCFFAVSLFGLGYCVYHWRNRDTRHDLRNDDSGSMRWAFSGGLGAVALTAMIYNMSIGDDVAAWSVLLLGTAAFAASLAYDDRNETQRRNGVLDASPCLMVCAGGLGLIALYLYCVFNLGNIWDAVSPVQFFQPVMPPTLLEEELNDSNVGIASQDPFLYENDEPYVKKMMGKDVVLS